jgi:hypothetical protein
MVVIINSVRSISISPGSSGDHKIQTLRTDKDPESGGKGHH